MKRSSGILKVEMTCLLFASIILIEATTTHGETKFFMDTTCGIPDRHLVSFVPSECTSFSGIIEELINLYGGQATNEWNYDTSCGFFLRTNERDARCMSEDIRVSRVSQDQVIPIATHPPGWNCMDGIPITGFLESPIAGQNVSGMTTIQGWAFHPVGISKVELFIDNQFVGTIPYGSNRMDVKNAYPSYPMAENSGFSTIWDYSILSSGNHTTKVRLHAGEITKDLDVLVTDQEAYNFELMWGSYGTEDGQFNSPTGVAVDSSGNVYVADTDNHRIQKFDSDGNFITIWGSEGTGDGQFNYPGWLALDSSGNTYIADGGNKRIQKLDSEGRFITKWDSPGPGDVLFDGPVGMAVDSAGNVYVTDSGNHRIQKFDSTGNSIAKWGSYGTGEGQFQWPKGIAVDLSGNVYISDTQNNRIQKYDSSGNFIRQWGSYGTEEGQFAGPTGIAIGSSGNLYIADTYNYRIQKFDSNGNYITKWDSSGGWLFEPNYVAVDSSGNVYVTDCWNKRILKFDLNGNFMTKWGDVGTGDGQFGEPEGIAVDSSGNVYVADFGNGFIRIQKFDSNGNFMTKWGSEGPGDGQFNSPTGVAVDSSGNVYVADTVNNRILKFDSDGNFIAKWGSLGYGNGEFQSLEGVAVDSSGNVYVADGYQGLPMIKHGYNRILKFNSNGEFVAKWQAYRDYENGCYFGGMAVDSLESVYVTMKCYCKLCIPPPPGVLKLDSQWNTVTRWGSKGNGEGQFNDPIGVAVDTSGNVYVVDATNNCIQKFDSNGNFITRWGSEGTGEGEFRNPEGLVVDSSGNVYVTDSGNNRIQKFSSPGRETISTPNSPGGPAMGLIGTSYSYSTGGSSSTLGHFIEYRFDWGDGTTSNWSPSPTASKSWTSAGTYAVKAQARCAADISILSGWSPGITVSISFITLQSPSNNAPYSPCSLDSPPVFSWNTGEAFKHYEIQFSGDGSFTSILAKMRVPTAATQVSIPLNTWKKALMIPATSGEKVYWRVIGVRTGGATETSEVWSIVIEHVQHVGNPALSPTRKSSIPELSWQTNCNKKFKVVFGNDSTFTKKTTFTFNLKNPTQEEFSKTLNPGQWMTIKRLVKNVSDSTVYWFVESWDGLGRYAKTGVMSFVLVD